MNKTLKYIFYSNAFVAISGGMFAFHDAIDYGFQYSIFGIVFLCCITWLSYQIPLINCFFIAKNEPIKQKDIWFVSHQKLMIITTIGLSFLAVYCFFNLTLHRQIVFLMLSFISITYVLPFKNYGLRQIPYLKIFLIAASWSALSVFWWRSIDTNSIILFVIRFLILIVVTLPFDIRDRKIDTQQGLKTLATKISNWKLTIITYSLLVISLLLCVLFNINNSEIWLISIALAAILFYKSAKNDLYYYFILDGIFLFHTVLILGLKMY